MIFGTSYFGNRYPKAILEDMKELKKLGFNEVLHTFSEEDFAYYQTPMKQAVADCHKLGLKVYVGPWAYGNAFGGQPFSKFIMFNRDEWQQTNDGTYYPLACLNSKKFQKTMYDWVDAAKEMGADGVFWDEPHWFIPYLFLDVKEGSWGCCCDNCKKLFLEMYGYTMPDKENTDARMFKIKKLNDFLLGLCDYAKSKGLLNTVCFLPIMTDDIDRQHWETVISHKSVDTFACDPYWELGPDGLDHNYKKPLKEYVAFFTKLAVELTKKHKKDCQIWIQNFSLYGDPKNVERAFDAAYEAGARNFYAWSYKGTEIASNRCTDSKACWNYFLNGIKKYGGKTK